MGIKDFNSDSSYFSSLTCNMDVRVDIGRSSDRSTSPTDIQWPRMAISYKQINWQIYPHTDIQWPRMPISGLSLTCNMDVRVHIGRSSGRSAPWSIKHRCLAYCYTHYQIQDNAYIQKTVGPPSQSNIDAFNTATPNIIAQYNAIQHRSSPVNRAQMPCILLHPLLHLGQCIYIEGIWTPQSIQHRCLAYCYTHCQIQDNAFIQKADGPPFPHSIKHRIIEYCYTKYISIAQCNPAQVLPSQLSTDALHTSTPTARSSLISGFPLLLELQKSLLVSFQGCQS